MKASETNFQPIIEGTKQYVVPLFQRAYSWDKREWEMLWEDLCDLCENQEPKSHFIGSIVTMPTVSVPEGVAKYLLIDGQQRLTTIFILMTLLRDKASKKSDSLADEINQTMLVNPFKKDNDRFKLLPTQVDRKSFQSLVSNDGNIHGESQIIKCYEFFERKLRQSNIEPQNLHRVVTNRLSVVSIVLDLDDNPHLVFESLNAKGRPLTQSDLIRNYFFMRVSAEKQEELYLDYWEPMQRSLSENLTEFIRHYLMRNGTIVKQTDVYFTLKDRVSHHDAISHLQELTVYAEYYLCLIDPSHEPDFIIRGKLERLKRLEVTTMYPFLLNCYHDFRTARISRDEFVRLLEILENYIIRRFVCNVPTSALNKIFPLLYNQAAIVGSGGSSFAQNVANILTQRGYPKDAEFRVRLKEGRLYGGGDRLTKTKLILESLESFFGHKERVDLADLTIEHVMPQALNEWWQTHLGEDWDVEHQLYIHNLGNLTLTAYNSELSNHAFPEKCEQLRLSHVELNRYFDGLTEWRREQIEQRAETLATVALEIWPYFGNDQSNWTQANYENVTGKIPRLLIMNGQEVQVESWRDVLRSTLNTLVQIAPDSFENLALEYPGMLSNISKRNGNETQLDNGYFLYIKLSARSIYNFCTQAVALCGLSPHEWRVLMD